MAPTEAAAGVFVMLHPNRQLATLACILVGVFVGYWILWRRNAPVIARAGTG